MCMCMCMRMDSAHVSIQQLLNCFQSVGEQDMFEANNFANVNNVVAVKPEEPDDDAPLAPTETSPSDDTVPDVKNVDDAWFLHTLIVLDGHTYMYMHEG